MILQVDYPQRRPFYVLRARADVAAVRRAYLRVAQKLREVLDVPASVEVGCREAVPAVLDADPHAHATALLRPDDEREPTCIRQPLTRYFAL